ncbi:MAG: hypothetical protein FJY40_05405 [Betaproteobacteria bacterium]|nr:hypothetical protein [Betaproteobacteria bacterium]
MAKNLFGPASPKPFALSRSKEDLFIECPRCFYLDRRLGIGRPAGFPFNFNSAVDAPRPSGRPAGLEFVPA